MESALECLREGLETLQKSQNPPKSKMAEAMDGIGSEYFRRENYSNAECFFRQALELRENDQNTDEIDLIKSLNNMGIVEGKKGNHGQAIAHLERAESILSKKFPEGHPRIAIVYNNLGTELVHTKEYQKAYDMQKKSLEILEKCLNTPSLSMVTVCKNLSDTCRLMGCYEESTYYHNKAEEIFSKIESKERWK